MKQTTIKNAMNSGHIATSVNSIVKMATIVLITLGSLSSCNSPEKKVENAQENVNDAQLNLEKAEADYVADMEKFKRETDDRIVTNQKSIDDFNAKISTEKKEAREEYRKRINELEQKNKDMKKRMDEYKPEGNEKWQSFKREFNSDMEQLGNALKGLGKNDVK